MKPLINFFSPNPIKKSSPMKTLTGRFDVLIKQQNTEQRSRLFDCTLIEFAGNHIMIYRRQKLVFKVWLKYNKWESYKTLKEAMDDVGIDVYEFR